MKTRAPPALGALMDISELQKLAPPSLEIQGFPKRRHFTARVDSARDGNRGFRHGQNLFTERLTWLTPLRQSLVRRYPAKTWHAPRNSHTSRTYTRVTTRRLSLPKAPLVAVRSMRRWPRSTTGSSSRRSSGGRS